MHQLLHLETCLAVAQFYCEASSGNGRGHSSGQPKKKSQSCLFSQLTTAVPFQHFNHSQDMKVKLTYQEPRSRAEFFIHFALIFAKLGPFNKNILSIPSQYQLVQQRPLSISSACNADRTASDSHRNNTINHAANELSNSRFSFDVSRAVWRYQWSLKAHSAVSGEQP